MTEAADTDGGGRGRMQVIALTLLPERLGSAADYTAFQVLLFQTPILPSALVTARHGRSTYFLTPHNPKFDFSARPKN